MKAIGGFFELEIVKGNTLYHDDAIKLTTGRSCLNYLLTILNPSKIYLPFYCCDALVDPLIINNIDYEFYSIDEQLEIINRPVINSNEYLIAVDFFGIKTNYMNSLIDYYKDHLIVDNTHAFFTKGYRSPNYSFTSARKYFGVPDGAFLYLPDNKKANFNLKRNTKISLSHALNRLLGFQEISFLENTEYEKKLSSNIEKISIFSERVLSSIDYQEVKKIRNENYCFFRKELEELNTLNIAKDEKDCFCYPLFPEKPIDKKELFKEKIYVPSLWLDTLSRDQKNEFEFECTLSNNLLPLPIDHRYTTKDLQRVVEKLKSLMSL